MQTNIDGTNIPYPKPKKLLRIGYKGFWKITNVIKKMPYPVRWCYWSALYYYNKYKFPQGEFTLELYRSYAKNK